MVVEMGRLYGHGSMYDGMLMHCGAVSEQQQLQVVYAFGETEVWSDRRCLRQEPPRWSSAIKRQSAKLN